MIEKTEITFPNVLIKNVSIYRNGKKIVLFDESEFQNSPDNFSSVSINDIVLDENMFGGPAGGSITLQDSVGMLEQLNPGIYDFIELNIVGYYNSETTVFRFKILDYTVLDNLAKKQIHGPSGIKTVVTIRFTSDCMMYRDYDIQTGMSNFIGKISKNKTEEQQNSFQNPNYLNLVSQEEEDKMEGFVQTLFNLMLGTETESETNEDDDTSAGAFGSVSGSLYKKLEADETFNDIWVKSNPIMYPFSKLSNNAKPLELLNYICEYACLKENPNAVDFFVWEDLDKWNFKSITSLAKNEIKAVFDLDEYEHFSTSIITLNVINEARMTELVDKGCFFSEYIRVKPNWSNPYRHVVDTGTSLIKNNITFNYEEDIKQPVIGNKKIATDKNLKNIKENKLLYYSNNRLTDNLFGYYSAPYNTSYSNFYWWNYYNFYSDGFTGDRMQKLEQINNEEDILNIKSTTNESFDVVNEEGAVVNKTRKREDIAQITRLEKEYWQSQFDFCELPGAILRIIYKDIKYPLIEARYNYAKLKNTKNMWSVYKKNICCEREVPFNFFAILTNADKIYGSTASESFSRDSGGIYAYSWAEVEVWPKSYLQSLDIWDKTKKIIEFEDQNFPFVFIMPSHAFVGGASKEFTLNSEDPLNESEGGITGVVAGKYWTPDTRAFNINELLNSVAPIGFEDGTAYQTLIMNPGITDVLGNLTTNRSNFTNYPTETVMMPIGKFRIISNTCPDFSSSGTELPTTSVGQNSGGFYYAGRIVQMHAIPKDVIQSFYSVSPRGSTAEQLYKKPDLGITGLSHMFLFDVENAHDGLCNSDNCQ